MLTRNKARLLHIEIPPISNIESRKKKRTNTTKCSPPPPSHHPKMVSFEENIDYITYIPIYTPPLYDVCIDFDDAHDAWVANKIKQKNGCYKYRKTRQPSKYSTKSS
jgi:hypothetical protein